MRLERRITAPESRNAHAERREAAEQEAKRRFGPDCILSLANGRYYASPLGAPTRELET